MIGRLIAWQTSVGKGVGPGVSKNFLRIASTPFDLSFKQTMPQIKHASGVCVLFDTALCAVSLISFAA
jgi:hypothetical protein